MWIKKEGPSKLLLTLGGYFGFSILCGISSMLFFLWATHVVVYNYSEVHQLPISAAMDYWIQFICIFVGIFLTIFVLILLLHRKFCYMIEISRTVESMETGNLSARIPIQGDDELGDLAASINRLAQAMERERARSEALTYDRLQTVATLSHDIRTPLTSVMSYLQFIRDGQYGGQEQLQSYAERAYEKALRMKDMTDDLFETCMTDEAQPHILERVSGTSFVSQIFYEMKSFLQESDFKVSVTELSDSSSFFLLIDRANISRVFDNVISNIEKYADRLFPVELRAEVVNGWLVLQQKNAVIEDQQKRNIASTLLGLKGVEKIIQKSGGTLHTVEAQGMFQLEIQLPLS